MIQIPDENIGQSIYQDRVTSIFALLTHYPELLAKSRQEVLIDFGLINENARYHTGLIIPRINCPTLICWEQDGLRTRFGVLVSVESSIIVTPDVFLITDNIHPNNSNWIILDSQTQFKELCYAF
jgi:hypothetical protein